MAVPNPKAPLGEGGRFAALDSEPTLPWNTLRPRGRLAVFGVFLASLAGCLVIAVSLAYAAANLYLTVNEVIRFSFHPILSGSTVSQEIVTTTAVQRPATALSRRRNMCVRASSTRDLYYGWASTVTTSNGFLLPAGSERCFTLDDAVTPFFIAASSSTDFFEQLR